MKTVEKLRDESYKIVTCCGNCAYCKEKDGNIYCYAVYDEPLRVEIYGAFNLWEDF